MSTLPCAWTIAGADPSGGAGLAADLRTFAAFGVHGACVVTAVTAQGLSEFFRADPVEADLVTAQLDALATMPKPGAVKIGMLGSHANAAAVARALAPLDAFVVLDPVLRATSGGELADEATERALPRELLPRVDLLTPNVPEAERLTGLRIGDAHELPAAAAALLRLGARRVLLKGGHLGGELVHDYYTDGTRELWLTLPRREGAARGTGCTLASAVAAAVAGGEETEDALVLAKAYVGRGLRLGRRLGGCGDAGPALLGAESSPHVPDDFPWLTRTLAEARQRPRFPDCGPAPLGFYPVVDRASWVRRLVKLGVTTLQLRVKDLAGAALEAEVRGAIDAARTTGARLFINDHWQLALRLGAYGVHLGQEDLDAADMHSLAASGLRLGISTHSYAEAARAKALRPSYVALGPIFATTCKSMRFGPQGWPKLRVWRSLFDAPLVAIGGLRLEHAAAARAAGADSVAVVSDVLGAADPDARVRAWLAAFEAPRPQGAKEVP